MREMGFRGPVIGSGQKNPDDGDMIPWLTPPSPPSTTFPRHRILAQFQIDDA